MTVRITLLAACSLAAFFSALATANTTHSGLPESFEANPAIQSPADFWGFEVGEFHPRYHQIVEYFNYLGQASDRVHVEVSGYTHDRRPILFVVFAEPSRDWQAIRARRKESSRSGEGPLVTWLGYSVHGNEASAASAAVETAYYLAASNDDEVMQWLDDMVIVMEPVLNPDGLDRFTGWVNMHRGQHPSDDPNDREHNERWPNGRTNYYWFDLNRDWMPLVHPESQARMAQYYAWQPHLLTDFHEMGRNSTYFFQPGVPDRNNPLTPDAVFELTDAVAQYHAQAMDEAQEPYYTKESFDDYYVGKGSTYPDLTGGIGILFEQGSSRGHVQDTDYGVRSFADAIANQVRTSLSSLRGAAANAEALIDYQQSFFSGARDRAKASGQAGWVIADGGDPAKAHVLLERLLQHQIVIHEAREPVMVKGVTYQPGSVWIVPADQDQYRLIESLLEPVTELSMETFYDVSTWPLGLAYDLPVEAPRRLPRLGPELQAPALTMESPVLSPAMAWVIPWNQYHAPAVLAGLIRAGYRIQATTEPMMVSDQALVRGSLVIHPGIQPEGLPPVYETLNALVSDFPVEVIEASGGLAQAGPDLGSPSVPVLAPIRPAVLVGNGVNMYNAGYIWFWFDHQLGQAITQLDIDALGGIRLSDYTHIIVPDGSYRRAPQGLSDDLVEFVRGGGTLIATRQASEWVEGLDFGWDWVESDDAEDDDSKDRRAYADHTLDFAREVIGGSALSIDLDVTHPLGFGYQDDTLTVFRRGRHVLKEDQNHYTRAGIYRDPVLVSGYLGEHNKARLAGTPALVATRHGRGVVVRMADDFLFRGYWLGSERLFANALFFSQLIGTTRLPSD